MSHTAAFLPPSPGQTTPIDSYPPRCSSACSSSAENCLCLWRLRKTELFLLRLLLLGMLPDSQYRRLPVTVPNSQTVDPSCVYYVHTVPTEKKVRMRCQEPGPGG